MRRSALLASAVPAALALLAACGEARPYADAPATSAAAAQCGSCHGDAATASRLSGAHAAHVAAGGPSLACGECHVVPATVGAPGHADGEADVVFGQRAGAAAARWDAAAKTCAVACHGTLDGAAAKPVWTGADGGAGALACGSCHAIPPPAPHTTSTLCGSCHPGYTATTVDATLHRNGRVDVTAQACGSCHAIPPATGRHAKHVNMGFSCGTCHAGASTTSGGPAHMNGVTDVSAPGWNASQTSCANSCHGTEYW
jgi:predicted CxxxxCH...CXXCH cytochrome family protein